MRMQKGLLAATCAAGLLGAQGAQAHIVFESGGWADGVLHPLLGADHVLAMLAVGLWAAQLGGRALWAVPLAFVSVLGLGAAAGAAGMPLASVELGIAASVLALGLLVAFAVRLPVAVGMTVAAVFAFLHGHAHGTEWPALASAWGYAGGFLLATALLHATGIMAGRTLNAKRLQFVGAGFAMAGLTLIARI
ncbi:MAG TPA: HupE/UreJ family protein [Casimicrobiaceae bacterium]|nr:HupE/UreJ family protein [Casimicrobiaceae bacterium]